MGNGIGKLCLCSTGAGNTSRRHQNNNPFGNSIFYIRPPDTFSDDFTTFRSLSGASVSANSSTPPSTVTTITTTEMDSSASFESSTSFTSSPMPLQQHAGSSAGSCSAVWCSPTKKFPRRNLLKKILKRVVSVSKKKKNAIVKVCDVSLQEVDGEKYMDNDDDDEGGGLFFMGSENLQWAQGRAGEDRLHIVISEKHKWVFVGIYDGFNGPDATDYLLENLFFSVYDQLKEILLELDEKYPNLDSVLFSLSEALRKTEEAFMKSVDEMINNNSVLAMMGSCVLVMLMKGEDVYLMNVGDSRAVLATHHHSLKSLQLTMEHSTLIKEEVCRIRKEHPDDPSAISKGRVKGYLNVTRAFGAGFLKQSKQNNAILEAFKVNYIGDSPYITCSPSLHHHRLNPSDKFLILCSDGLNQYFTNEEAVAKVESFITLSPEIDPAQLLIKEALCRAAKKAGMNFHELLDIPQGERRLYHDDISIVIISFEGKIWRSSI